MQLPLPYPAARRAARNGFLPVLALLHLSSFSFLRSGFLGEWTTGWTVSAFIAAGFLVFRDLATSRRENHLPDILSQVAWGVTALLELHALSSAVASSRIVPAAVFPAISFLLPALPAAIYAFSAFVWLSWSPLAGFGGTGTSASIAALAVLGMVTGRAVRNKMMTGNGEMVARKPIGGGRSIVLTGEGDNPPASREEESGEGIQRILEGILPISGADRVMYVSTSHVPGSPLVARHIVPRPKGASRHDQEQEIPDSYVPLQEAMIFRREFFAEGEESFRWGLRKDGKRDRPSGVAAVPVLGDGTEEGAILALRFGEGKWTDPVVPVLEMGAFFIAREVAGTRRRFRDERLLERQVGFNRLARTIAEAAEKSSAGGAESSSPRREVYKTTAEQIRLQLGADRVLLVEAEERRCRGRVVWGTSGQENGVPPFGGRGEEAWTGLGGTYAEWVLKNNVHRIFSGVRTSPGKHPVLPGKWTREDEDAYLLVPVQGAGGFRGILACCSRENRSYHKRDAETVKEILAIMRMGISHALHIETLEERATNDGLTGLLNQKTFRERLSSVLSRLDGRYECAVIMVDIDHFKRINDTYGHPAGDEVLKNISIIIRKTIRKVDMAGRYGGEEFVLYLHEADREKAIQVAERLRLIIGQTKFEFGGKEAGVTASLGIACYPSRSRDGRELLEHADEALYRSKQGGRNRTTVYGEPA